MSQGSRIGNHQSQMPAVVLLSGGLDSYTAAAIAQQEGFSLYALTVRYGQRHAHEIHAARAVADALGVERHVELDVNLSVFGGSSLTSDLPVPKDRVAWREDLDPRIQAIRRVATTHQATLVPLDGVFAAAATKKDAAFWAADGVHPTLAGHALIAREVSAVLGM